MGNLLSGIFGGGYSAPDQESSTAMPTRSEAKEPESKAIREEERRKLKARRSMSGTVLTSPLGVSGQSSPGLLGRTINS